MQFCKINFFVFLVTWITVFSFAKASQVPHSRPRNH
uniref:Uncharacterized protein n=1 Tax=Tetranychus urticae TaxID=32264 RepID=T1JUQ1_TETUR